MVTNLRAEYCDSGWFEDYDCVPLRLRLKMLRARAYKTDDKIAVGNEEYMLTPTQSISLDHNEEGNMRSENRGSTKSRVCSNEVPASQVRANIVEKPLKVEVGAVSHSVLADVPDDANIHLHDNIVGSSTGLEQGCAVKHEILYEFDGHLDDIVLRERRKMLVSRKSSQSSGPCIKDQGNNGRLFNSSEDMLQGAHVDIRVQKSIYRGLDGDHGASRSGINEICEAEKKSSLTIKDDLRDAVEIESTASATLVKSNSFGKPEMTMANADAMAGTVSSFLARVKHEPVDISELCREKTDGVRKFFTGKMLPVKSEPGLSEFLGDELDYLPLVDRIKLLTCGASILDKSQSVEFCNENVASALDVGSDVVESVKPISISRSRKKRKTATNSVGTALEEDAPALLKLLIERGISLEEIKLYGEEESGDALDELLIEDSFAELEAVISQLFSQRQSFLKLPPLRFTKGEKASYCLSCLLSLVEQSRYLQHRKWPVEWGWCRELQAFIFVFQRHNRIVLERPEYGFATYFFELLNSIPVHWQIKRLVIAMKLSSCGRIALIENKPLVVGEDLSEGEARVLAEYGWTPNTGLGTMLNYCDRVVHDRKQEINSLEWRSKIAKQLVNGYNGGNIISKDLPKKLAEYHSSQSVQVKLEQ